jgi:lipopolysaccharide assembly protein A
MKLISTLVGVVLFVLFFGFAVKNTQEVDLHFFLNYELRGPLVLMLLGFFASGAALGVLALTPTVFRHRREASRHRSAAIEPAPVRFDNAPQPDGQQYGAADQAPQ